MHSRAKLALAVITSPGAAFEEILERKLLGTGLVFVLIAGTLSSAAAVTRAMALGPLDWFTLGHYNPVAWFGLFLLYALALQKLLRWLGTDVGFVNLLIVMGWAQIMLVVVELLATLGGIRGTAAHTPDWAAQGIGALGLVLAIGYVAAIGIGIRVATGVPTARGVMSYMVVAMAAAMGLTYLYSQSRTDLFSNGLPGIGSAAQQVAAADTISWLGAGVLGLVLGVWHLAKELSWETRKRNARVAAAAVLGLAAFVPYVYVFSTVDYYGRLLSAQQDYSLEKYDRAALKIRALISMSKVTAPGLALDTADLYFLARKPRLAIRYYERFRRMIEETSPSKGEDRNIARALVGIGAVHDQQRRYDLAIREFKAATEVWRDLRDPWVRLAVTYDGLGDYVSAIQNGEHAVKRLKSEAVVAQVALAQAYTATGDTKKAEAAIRAVREADDKLAKRVEKSPGGWKRAVDALTPSDLKFPLEREVVMPPKKPGRVKTQLRR